MRVRIKKIEDNTYIQIEKVSSVTQFEKQFCVSYNDEEGNYSLKYYSLEKYEFSVWEN